MAILTLGKWRQEHQKVTVILGYVVDLRAG